MWALTSISLWLYFIGLSTEPTWIQGKGIETLPVIGKSITELIYVFNQSQHGRRESMGILESRKLRAFPGGPVVKNLPCNARDTGLIPGLGRSHMPWSN